MRPRHPSHLPPPRRRATAGVTLVEVVIAIFVLTVGVLGIISLFPSGYELGRKALDESVASLAARDALARITAEARRNPTSFYPDPESITEKISKQGVVDAERVGTVYAVNTHSLECRVPAHNGPAHWGSSPGNLQNYYCVMTSGAAAGRAYRIYSSAYNSTTDRGTLTFDSSGIHEVTFRVGTATTGEPIRVGDHFAIIGSLTGAKCFPTTTTGTGFSAFLGTGTLRTWEIATHGSLRPMRENTSLNPPWEYSYGCIISAPSSENLKLYRVDVFVYRGFDPTGTMEQQKRPAGHSVTYILRPDDYQNP